MLYRQSISTFKALFLLLCSCCKVGSLSRRIERIELPTGSIGTRRNLIVYHYGSPDVVVGKHAYIQASLHADELPGMLVVNHLIKMLDKADKSGQILGNLDIVPFANPIGLAQQLMGIHVGRFSVESGINFNREYPDVVAGVTKRIEGQLTTDADTNVKLIRSAMRDVIAGTKAIQEEVAMKKALYSMAVGADIVLDLHCDSHAVMHMYTHDRLWPVVADLAAELGSECHLLAPAAGGDPFDEACSCPWAALADHFPSFPIPMACQAVTVELRGESDVYDEYAITDAEAIFRFLQRRGLISMDACATAVTTAASATTGTTPKGAGASAGAGVGTGGDTATCDSATAPLPTSARPLPALIRDASPLSGVDMVEAETSGVVAWRVKPGQVVADGDLLGEIIDCEDPEAPRVPVRARTSGVVFSMSRHKLVRPGNVIIKVAGVEPLPWRTGNLLTSR